MVTDLEKICNFY